MTQKQKGDFLLYGCMSRAVMKVCGESSVEDFCSKYDKWFQPQYYGMPRMEKFEDILSDVGYKSLGDESDFSKVLSHFRAKNPVIVFSHVAFGDNETNELNHSSVLHDADDNSFQLWTAYQNGGDGVFPPFPKQKWIDKKCHGILLSQSGSNGGQPV